MAKEKPKLSENLEDYLEAIQSISARDGAVRPSDIARELKVKRPSVTSALNSLAAKGLVEYEKYRPVVLTKDGEAHARGISKKHSLLREFFTDVLGVQASEADLVACKMEHIMDDSVMKKFTKFFKGIVNPCAGCPSCGEDGCAKNCRHAVPLSSLKVGGAGLILKIEKSIGDMACFAGMGLVIGSRVEIARIAPLGDPVVLKVRGSEISLRKSQLEAIIVKPL
ncbi:MAG: metal-dependent transcriptional regulator [Opitutales bacterium]|nr:metal-dependent transcriptional regulator [Opitutales bacterium]